MKDVEKTLRQYEQLQLELLGHRKRARVLAVHILESRTLATPWCSWISERLSHITPLELRALTRLELKRLLGPDRPTRNGIDAE